MSQITVHAPATVANVACGFDVFGFAIEGPGDLVHASENSSFSGVKIAKIIGDDGRLPLDAKKNTAGIATSCLLKKMKSKAGVVLEIEKNMPFASGMGSSAASAAGAVKAVNELLQLKATNNQMLECIIESEKSTGGTAHADNAAPSLLGGFALVRGVNPVDVISLPLPDKLHYAIVHPQVEVNTSQARAALPKIIPLEMAVRHWSNTASLVHALHTSDYDLLSRCLEDLIAEPVRSQWIPKYRQVKIKSLEAGALACNISGSGPSVFALCSSADVAARVALAMKAVYDIEGMKCSIFHGKIRAKGAEIL